MFFIDEIQNFPDITKVIKYLIDHHQVKFIVTGSSNYYFAELVSRIVEWKKVFVHPSPIII